MSTKKVTINDIEPLLERGQSNREIARTLCVSEGTVRNLVRKIADREKSTDYALRKMLEPTPAAESRAVDAIDFTQQITQLTAQIDDLKQQLSSMQSQINSKTDTTELQIQLDCIVIRLDALESAIPQKPLQQQLPATKSRAHTINTRSLQPGQIFLVFTIIATAGIYLLIS